MLSPYRLFCYRSTRRTTSSWNYQPMIDVVPTRSYRSLLTCWPQPVEGQVSDRLLQAWSWLDNYCLHVSVTLSLVREAMRQREIQFYWYWTACLCTQRSTRTSQKPNLISIRIRTRVNHCSRSEAIPNVERWAPSDIGGFAPRKGRTALAKVP